MSGARGFLLDHHCQRSLMGETARRAYDANCIRAAGSLLGGAGDFEWVLNWNLLLHQEIDTIVIQHSEYYEEFRDCLGGLFPEPKS